MHLNLVYYHLIQLFIHQKLQFIYLLTLSQKNISIHPKLFPLTSYIFGMKDSFYGEKLFFIIFTYNQTSY